MSFTPLFTYKVLKQLSDRGSYPKQLYTFIYLQGSQTYNVICAIDLMLYTFIYLQGSQTEDVYCMNAIALYTFIYLQGSQT